MWRRNLYTRRVSVLYFRCVLAPARQLVDFGDCLVFALFDICANINYQISLFQAFTLFAYYISEIHFWNSLVYLQYTIQGVAADITRSSLSCICVVFWRPPVYFGDQQLTGTKKWLPWRKNPTSVRSVISRITQLRLEFLLIKCLLLCDTLRFGDKGSFFCFSLTRGRVCGRQQKQKQKNTLNTRGCSFGVPLNTRGPYTNATRQEHKLNTRVCSFEYHWTREDALHARHTVQSKVQKHVHAPKRRYTLYRDDIWPPFPRERDRNPLPFRVPLVLSMFFISQPRVSGPKTEQESFFLGRRSRVCGWRICEKPKKGLP